MTIISLRTIAAFFAALLAIAAVHAQTPDGMTPAEETVCDVYSGAAFGLCNAYCEAMDCGHPEQAASPRACERVLSNFEKITGITDGELQMVGNCGICVTDDDCADPLPLCVDGMCSADITPIP